MSKPDAIVVFDAHVHLYPEFNLDIAIRNLIANLSALARPHLASSSRPDRQFAPQDVQHLALLTEARGTGFFKAMIARPLQTQTCDFRQGPESGSLDVFCGNERRLSIIVGTQIVSRERIEILSLASAPEGLDGEPGAAIVEKILAAGGVPVLSWAPGKWFLDRGRLARQILRSRKPSDLLIGDTSLRATAWPEPLIMREAKALGFGIVAGSDPLPLPGEEGVIGTYGCCYSGPFDPQHPVTSIRRILLHEQDRIRRVGRRGGSCAVAWRLIRHFRASRTRKATAL